MPKNISQYGNASSLASLPSNVEVLNMSALAISAPTIAASLHLVQYRQSGAFQEYNTTAATKFIPGWSENFTVLIQIAGGTNYTYPFHESPHDVEWMCNWQNVTTTVCSVLTTVSYAQSSIQVTNFTTENGGKGWAYQDFATWWVNSSQYSIHSAGYTPMQIVQIAQAYVSCQNKHFQIG